MSEAKRLLEQATPLPWSGKRGHPKDQWAPNGYRYVQLGKDTSYTTGDLLPGDAALIVYAVNRLPLYEEALAATERLLDVLGTRHSRPEWLNDVRRAEADVDAAINRLRGAA